jgi:hypothetical protein
MGYVRYLPCEVRGYSAEDPTWEEVEAALNALDGDRMTALTMQGVDHSVMMIGGGNGGRIICEVDVGRERAMYRLKDPAAAESDFVELRIGGQTAKYWAPLCPTIELAGIAAKTCWEDGSIDDRLAWHVDR